MPVGSCGCDGCSTACSSDKDETHSVGKASPAMLLAAFQNTPKGAARASQNNAASTNSSSPAATSPAPAKPPPCPQVVPSKAVAQVSTLGEAGAGGQPATPVHEAADPAAATAQAAKPAPKPAPKQPAKPAPKQPVKPQGPGGAPIVSDAAQVPDSTDPSKPQPAKPAPKPVPASRAHTQAASQACCQASGPWRCNNRVRCCTGASEHRHNQAAAKQASSSPQAPPETHNRLRQVHYMHSKAPGWWPDQACWC